MPLVIDIETRSLCDLKECGADAYSRHPSTEVLCICVYDPEIDKRKTYNFSQRLAFPDFAMDTLLYDTFVAHNIAFEKAILSNTLCMGGVDLFRWIDTADIAAYFAAPLSLEGAAGFLLRDDNAKQKDMEGKKLMYKICRPNNKKKGTFSKHTEEEFQGLMDYCMQDVMVSAELYKQFWHMVPEFERETMAFTQRLNRRGIYADLDLVDKLLEYYAETCGELELPEGVDHTNARSPAFITKYSQVQMCPMDNAQAETVQAVLDSGRGAENLRKVLEARQVLTLASIKKLNSLKARTAGDPWVRNGFQYHGSKTGRYAGRGVQPQNLPKGFSEDVDIVLARCMVGADV